MLKGYANRCARYENEFAHENTTMFRATARRDRLVGHWAAEQLGLKGEEAEEYAKMVARTQIVGGETKVVDMLNNDLSGALGMVDQDMIVQKMQQSLEQAMRELREGVPEQG